MATAQVVKISDFNIGRNRIPRTSFQIDSLQDYIDEHEEETLISLLGLDLYNLFLADLDANGVPLSARFIAIYDSFVIDDDCDRCRSRDMIHMLIGIIFFHYQRDQSVRATTVGSKRKKGSNSESIDLTSFDIFTRYNNSVNDYKCIRRKICDDIETYPEFKGIDLEYVINT